MKGSTRQLRLCKFLIPLGDYVCVVAEVIRSYIITSFTEIERPTRDTCFISSHPLLALPYGTIVCRQGGQLTILELYNYLLSLFSPVLQLEVNNHNLKLKLKNSSYNYNTTTPHRFHHHNQDSRETKCCQANTNTNNPK